MTFYIHDYLPLTISKFILLASRSIEAKLATITDLLTSVEQGQQITARVVEKADLLKVALPEHKQTLLDSMKQSGETDWHTYVAQLTETK